VTTLAPVSPRRFLRLSAWCITLLLILAAAAAIADTAVAAAAAAFAGDVPADRSEASAGAVRRLDAAGGRALLCATPLVSDSATLRAAGSAEELVFGGVAVLRLTPGTAIEKVAADSGLDVLALAPWWSDAAGHPLSSLQLLFFADEISPAAAAARIEAVAGVEWAEACRAHRVSALPDDPRIADQTYLEMIRAAAAWDLARGEWNPVAVAVVDAGIDIGHPDLAANVLLNDLDPLNGFDDDGNGFIDDHRGWNFAVGSDDGAALADATPSGVAHGTHVAGLVSAVADNSLDVAGLTWNGPILCVSAGSAVADNVVTFGFQGILYAAERGARIINCSWGRQLTKSSLEAEILDYVHSLGGVVIAAAGNDNQPYPFYPAAYRNVVAVASVGADSLRYFTSNYGDWVDLAAPGVDLLSLDAGEGVSSLTGTSMATPLVSAAAALLAGLRPDLTTAQVVLQLRVSSSAFPGSSSGEELGIGHGILSVESALGWDGPGLRIVDIGVVDEDGDGFVGAGEVIELRPVWSNLLGPASGPIAVTLALAAESGILVQDGIIADVASVVLPPVPAGGSVTIDAPIVVVVSDDLPIGAGIALRWDWTDATAEPVYRDMQITSLVGPPLTLDLLAGEIDLSLPGNGRLGFRGNGGGDGSDGIGVRYDPINSQQGVEAAAGLLFEGAFMAATGPDRVSDAARYASNGSYHRYWNPETAADLPRTLPRLLLAGGQELTALRSYFSDSEAPSPLGLRVTATALAPDPELYPGLSLLLISMANRSGQDIVGLRAGWFLDWDLADSGPVHLIGPNSTARDSESGLALTWRDSDPLGLTVATDLVGVGSGPAGLTLIDNAAGADWNIYDGFTDQEKWDSLVGELDPPAVGGTDVSQVLELGPFDIAPGDSMRCVLLIAAGGSRAMALENAGLGRGLAQLVLAETQWQTLPVPRTIGAPYPNPANGSVSVDVSGNHLAPWRMMVYDLRGRLVHRAESMLPGGNGTLSWNCLDRNGRPAASGMYLLTVEQPDIREKAKFTLLR